MIIRKLRLDKGLSQEQLAEMAGISTRTLQRIERGATASPETLKCLAAVLEVDFKHLREEQMTVTQPNANSTPSFSSEPDGQAQRDPNAPTFPTLSEDEQQAMEYVRDIKSFYSHAVTYVCVIALIAAINLVFHPDRIYFIWPALGWGIGLAVHALSTFEVFSLFGDDWEKRQINKRLKGKR